MLESARRAALAAARRIRLVAYGARLESVLGESPRGFESPILRKRERPPCGAAFLVCGGMGGRGPLTGGGPPAHACAGDESPIPSEPRSAARGGSFWTSP